MKEIKAIDRWLTSLLPELETGDSVSFALKLVAGLTSDILVRFRERKLILKAPAESRMAIARVLYESTEASIAHPERELFFRYLQLAIVIDSSRLKLLQKIHLMVDECSPCSLQDLLAAGQVSFDWILSKYQFNRDEELSRMSVAEREHYLHELNGMLNDTTTAIARAINEWSHVNKPNKGIRLTRGQVRKMSKTMLGVIRLASEVNTFEWIADCVTYGDFIVDESTVTPLRVHRLQFADARRQLLRRLAIRRELVMKYSQRRIGRYVRDMLAEMENASLDHAVKHYLLKSGRPISDVVDLDHARATSKASLILIDAEDDLLLAAAELSPDAQSYYFAAMILRWYTAGANAVSEAYLAMNNGTREIAAIPVGKIIESIEDGADGDRIKNALHAQLSELPAPSHQALVSRPFIRLDESTAMPLLGGHLGVWNVAVRESLIQGGVLGKNFGAIWEDFLAKQFEQSDWKIAGRNVKLKTDGRLITDVDLILLRGDLLLIVQIKAMIGSGITIYDHWKNRQTIQFGCSQAKIAVDFFKSNPGWLVSICGKKSVAEIKYIQPVVLTNVDQLNGWVFDEVPVISELTRKTICDGSKVNYFDGRTGELKHTHHFVKKEDLGSDEILRLIRHSVELDISLESSEVTHREIIIGDCCFLLPEFLMREESDVAFSYAPSS
ncbi:hypothetical protein GJ697_09830 [Pseudoduganella sp. FT25W]|uniref:NERD domain-containing protein n=1 Tax=Duganella alba TaxID=2666081 RepID=A0A6L5QGJ4_9BURK|nr:hypothetical protein [Duganella alba]MRX08131.1 hypothetical protein [Duganella alba]MRX16332.1 hypothetical protein [Duganella alba]